MARAFEYSRRLADLLSPARGKTAQEFFLDWRLPEDTGHTSLLCAELVRLAYAPQEVVAAALPRAGLALADWLGGETLGERWRSRGTDGFVTQADEAGRVLVVFRGTESDKPEDLLSDLKTRPVACPWAPGRVHAGFLAAYQSVRGPLQAALSGASSAGARVVFTGHSLGAAVATLAAADWQASQPGRAAELVTFGSPRVGDALFAAGLDHLTTARHVHCADVVTRVPPGHFSRDEVADILGGFVPSAWVLEVLARTVSSVAQFALGDPGFVHVGALRYIDAVQRLHAGPPDEAGRRNDRLQARAAYGAIDPVTLPDGNWPQTVDGLIDHVISAMARHDARAELVAWRDLADHAPINYLSALAASASS